MKRVRLQLAVAALVISCVLYSLPISHAQRNAIDTYAITNARLVTLSGPVVERGTIVVRDGLIIAVGANVTAPADARVIDGAGLTVYPGLIDAHTSLALPEPSPSPSPGGGAAGFLAQLTRPPVQPGPNSTQPPGLQPEVRAEDLIRAGGDQIDSARNAGITAALTAPRGGIWNGQAALINLAGDSPQAMIVRSPVAMHVGFTPLRGQYPNSLLGVFSTLRQMLLDAQTYRESQQTYARSSRGLRRPGTDRSLEALLPVLDGKLPVVFQAEREREIRRALDLAEEFKLKAIIAGGADSWRVADRLQKADVAVLLSLNFPRRLTAALPQADPEPLRILRERAEAPKTAAKLAQARVKFAFQSGGLSYAELRANAGKTIEGGLLKDDAIRALTMRPAEIFGVSDRLGSLEVGKIANLTVTRGDLFDRNSQITHVFIDGRPVDLRPAAPSSARPGAAAGTWRVIVNLGSGDLDVTLNLRQEENQLLGSLQGALGSADIANATLSESGEIRFTAPVTVEGQTTEATFTGNITGNEMRGAVTITGRSPGSFTGTRAATPVRPSTEESSALAGTWSITIELGDQQLPGTLVINQQGRTVSGSIQTSLANSEFQNGSADANGFSVVTRATIQGQDLELTVTGKATGNRISGTISSQLGTVTFAGTRQG